MKNLITITICFLISTTLSALGTLRVESIKELPATHTNLTVYDADGKYAPVLIIKTELKGLGIQNVGRPTKHAPEYLAGDHQYKFYMNDNQRVVKITHADYEPLEVRLLADFGIEVKAQRVYELVLTNIPEKEFIIVNIVSEPADAAKIIDGKDMGTGQSFELFIGRHTLKLQKSGYKSISKDIEVSKSKTLFNNLELAEVEPVMITIKSEPTEADIYINNVNEGKTNKQLFKFPGDYELRLVKDKYDTVDETINISESGNNIFNNTLQKNTSILTINTIPSSSTIYLDNEKLESNQKEVSAGNHQVRIIKSGYDAIEETVFVEKGIDKTKTINLQKNTSVLTVNTTPSNCEIYINNENISGSSKELSAGMYRVEVKKEGYFEQSRTVNLEKGKNKTENFTLEQKTGKLQFVIEPMEAQVALKQGGSTVQNWSGSKYLSSLPVGNYSLTASLSGYSSQTKQVKINLDETMSLNMSLIKKQDSISEQGSIENPSTNIEVVVLAAFDGGEITLENLESRIQLIPPIYQPKYSSIDGKKSLLQDLCTEELFYQEALNRNVTQDERFQKTIDDQIKSTYYNEYIKNITGNNNLIIANITEKEKQNISNYMKTLNDKYEIVFNDEVIYAFDFINIDSNLAYIDQKLIDSNNPDIELSVGELNTKWDFIPSQNKVAIKTNEDLREYLVNFVELESFYIEAVSKGYESNANVKQNVDQIHRNMLLRTVYNQLVIDPIDTSEKAMKKYFKKNI